MQRCFHEEVHLMKIAIGVLAMLTAAAVLPAHAGGDCPKAVISAAESSHSGAKTVACHPERDEGAILYEVKIRTSDGTNMELEVDSEGAILETAEQIPTRDVPAAAIRALRAKHPDAKIREAERITAGDGEIFFELVFTSGGRTQEMTVTESGALVEVDDGDLGEGDADDADDEGADD
jgi:hypothetical protein